MKKTAGERIYEALKEAEGPLSTDNIVERTGIPRPTVYYNTSRLVKEGLIERWKGLPGIFSIKEDEKIDK